MSDEPAELDMIDDPRVSALMPMMFSEQDVERFEEQSTAMAADQPENYLSVFESAVEVRGMQLSAGGLLQLEREFRLCSAWHAARGRPLLKRKYTHLADVVHLIWLEQSN